MGGRGRGRGRAAGGGGGGGGRGRGVSIQNDSGSDMGSFVRGSGGGFWDMPRDFKEKAKNAKRKEKVEEKPPAVDPEEEIQAGKQKFETACKQIEQKVKEYYATHQFEDIEDDDEEDDEDLEQEGILDRVYGGYGAKVEDNRTQQYLQDSFKSGALICLICIDNIKRSDPIWSCEACYSSFHVPCVNKWAKDSIYQLSEAAQRTDKSAIQWCCPKCRCEYAQSKIPSKYLCFCGKQMDPKVDPWLIPHSCGETCGKNLKPECGHSCLLLCHPGPCPPCPRMVTNPCHCGQMPPQPRRCCSKAWSCGKPCGHNLSCGQHQCKDLCHPGECKKCPKKSRQKCDCGAESSMRDCAEPKWQCKKICSKKLSCGHHLCQKVCHSGECGNCPSSGKRKCPCGKSEHVLPCTEQIPSCGDTCGKMLSCGLHYCAERCHKTSCPPCLHFVEKSCMCGARRKEMNCSKEFTCETKCKKTRDCRRHTCNKKCCCGSCPRCEQPCGRMLSCGSHKCDSRCHQGPCYPCSVTHTISCRCGKTKITVPCGREKYTKPPKCSLPCRIPPNCHHPEREPHKCHPGSCPTCKIVCNLKLKCGHVCPKKCHDAVPVTVVDNSRRIGPWEPVAAPRIEIQKQPCPPCKVPVPTTCYGKHETPNWPCSELRPYSCGRKCGRALACESHTCERECHVVEEAPDKIAAGKNCAPCERPCKKPRPKGCSHKCLKLCHPGKCTKCKNTIKMRCHCSILSLLIECDSWTSATTEKESLQSCNNQCCKQMSCSHRCLKTCHSGLCSQPDECTVKVSMRCPCKRQKKEFMCQQVFSNKSLLQCNNACTLKMKEKEKEKEEEERKRREEKEACQKKEAEMLERKLEGKKSKRRTRKVTEPTVETTFWTSYQKPIIIFVAVVMAVSAYAMMSN